MLFRSTGTEAGEPNRRSPEHGDLPGYREVRGARPPAISGLQPLDERARVTLRGLHRGPSSSLQGRATPARPQGRPHPRLPRRRAPLAPLRQPLAGPHCEASLPSSRPLSATPALQPCSGRPRRRLWVPPALHLGSAGERAEGARSAHSGPPQTESAAHAREGGAAASLCPPSSLRLFESPERTALLRGAGSQARHGTRWAAGNTLSTRPAGR